MLTTLQDFYNAFYNNCTLPIILLLSIIIFTGIFKGDKLSNAAVFNVSIEHKYELKDFVMCFIVAIITSFQFYSLCFNGFYLNTDASVFAYIGREMMNGYVPYLDLFDHKGIILYFIQYIGFIICDTNSIGIWILEFSNLFVFSLILIKICGLITSNRIIHYLTLIIVELFFSSKLFDGGNYSEEYALPWIAIALYIFTKFYLKKTYKLIEIILLGISFMIVLFIRVNMVIVWVVYIPITLLCFVKEKKIKSIFICLVGFLSGCIIVIAPLLFYFLYTNSLYSMIECYLLFNFEYSSSVAISFGIIISKVISLTVVFPAIIILCVSMFSKEKVNIYYYSLVFFISTIIVIFSSGRIFSHYYIIMLPTMIIPTTMFLVLFYKSVSFRIQVSDRKAVNLIYISSLFLIISVVIFSYDPLNIVLKSKNESDNLVSDYICKNTNENDNVLVIGNNCKYYLQNKRSYSHKYFYQFPPIIISDSLYDDFIVEINNDLPDCVLISTSSFFCNNIDYGEKYVSFFDYFDKYVDDGVYRKETCDEFYVYLKEK